MKVVAASLPAPALVAVLAAMLGACGAADDPPARPEGEAKALERAEAMLAERSPAPQTSASPQP